jgi:inner centromere protein
MPSSAPGGSKSLKPLKKMHSMSQESLEESKKLLQNNAMNQLMEEKRKQREEKQRQAQLQREALEKEKRDQAMKLQMERDEKYRKIMKEKDDKQRMEALKKKLLKEKQAKKYAEERAKRDEFVAPKPVEPYVNKDDSLHLKLQKQIIQEKAEKQKKEESKNIYNFEMLHTDDSTDDEARPSQKRPAAPSWSKSEFEEKCTKVLN